MAGKKSNKQKIQHHHFFIGGVVAFFFAGAALAGALLLINKQNGAFGKKLSVFSVGQLITNNNYEVKVTQAKRSAGDPRGLTPRAGNEFIVVDLYVKNKTNQPVELFPSTQTYIKDASGQTFGTGVADVAHPFLAGDLSPGDSIKGELVYEVQKGVRTPKFYLEGLAQEPVVVKVN